MDRWNGNECGEADRRFLAVLEMEMDEQVTRGTKGPRDLSSLRAQPCCHGGTALVGAGDGGASIAAVLGYLELGWAHSPVLGTAKRGLWRA